MYEDTLLKTKGGHPVKTTNGPANVGPGGSVPMTDDEAIIYYYEKYGDLSGFGTISWYANHFPDVTHPTLHNYDDAKLYVDGTNKKVYGAYLRHRLNQRIKAKLGKGVVYVDPKTGKPILTRDHTSSDENPLETDIFIPCKDENAAFALEGAVLRWFGSKRVHGIVKNKVSMKENRWLEPTVNSEGRGGGWENFSFIDVWEDRKEVFLNAIKEITKDNAVGKISFEKGTAEYYQKDAAKLLCRWLDEGNDMRDFFLLMKPRSGKNCTVFHGLALYVKLLKDRGELNEAMIVDFISQWPSAFPGAIEDLEKYSFADGVIMKYINTQLPEYKEQFEQLKQDPKVDLIIRFASVQSIDKEAADAWNSDEELNEGLTEKFDKVKALWLKENGANKVVVDECDYGMRTKRSKAIMNYYGYDKIIWQSGTDLYAIRSLLNDESNGIPNHFLYDIFQEVQDVREGKIRRRPQMKKCTFKYESLPFDDITADEMNEHGISRRMSILCKTNRPANDKNSRYDKSKKLHLTGPNGDVVKFIKLSEFKSLWNMIYDYENSKSLPSPRDLPHIFNTMPTISACQALYNHIILGDIDCEHIPLLANMFNSASTIEQEVNDEMRRHPKTIFITVGKMLRGAKAPWNCVIRFDSYRDFKVGFQIELRGQNTEDPVFYVYDANIFRTHNIKYELVKQRTDGKKINTEGRNLNNLIPIYVKGQGIYTKESTWEDTEEGYAAGRISENYKKSVVLDSNGVENAKELLSTVDELRSSSNEISDPNEGTEGQNKDPKPDDEELPTLQEALEQLSEEEKQKEKEKEEKQTLTQRALTLSSMLPILLILDDCKHTEIDDLIKSADDELFESWLKDKCGLESILNLKMKDIDIKDTVIKIFNAEKINEQLSITARRLSHGEEIDWNEFSNKFSNVKKGDKITPDGAVNTILDQISRKTDITNIPSVLDVSCGLGEFSIELVKRGFTGDIYIADTNIINVTIAKKRLKKEGVDCKGVIVYTIENNEKDLQKKVRGMKFGLVIGNPPFQAIKKGDYGLWAKFIKLADNIVLNNGIVSYIVPWGWMSPTQDVREAGKGRTSILIDIFCKNNTLVIEYTRKLKNFFSDIGHDFSYFMYVKEPYQGKTEFITNDGSMNIDLRKYKYFPKNISRTSLSIFEKVFSKVPLNSSFDLVRKDRKSTGSDQPVGTCKYRYANGSSNHLNDWKYKETKCKFHDRKKIYIPYNGSSYKILVDDGTFGIGNSYILELNDSVNIENVKSIVNNKLYTYLTNQKRTQFNEGAILGALPRLDWNKTWTDDLIYKYFNLTLEEIDYVEKWHDSFRTSN